jgi:hypothetical protein
LIPAGELVTVPFPRPLFVTVSVHDVGGGGGGGGGGGVEPHDGNLKFAIRVFQFTLAVAV